MEYVDFRVTVPRDVVERLRDARVQFLKVGPPRQGECMVARCDEYRAAQESLGLWCTDRAIKAAGKVAGVLS